MTESHHAMETRSRKRRKLLESGLLSVSDDIMVEIAKYMAAQDYLLLLKVSKKLNRLLKTEAIVSKMIDHWNLEINRNRDSILLPSHSAPIEILSLEELEEYFGMIEDYMEVNDVPRDEAIRSVYYGYEAEKEAEEEAEAAAAEEDAIIDAYIFEDLLRFQREQPEAYERYRQMDEHIARGGYFL